MGYFNRIKSKFFCLVFGSLAWLHTHPHRTPSATPALDRKTVPLSGHLFSRPHMCPELASCLSSLRAPDGCNSIPSFPISSGLTFTSDSYWYSHLHCLLLLPVSNFCLLNLPVISWLQGPRLLILNPPGHLAPTRSLSDTHRIEQQSLDTGFQRWGGTAACGCTCVSLQVQAPVHCLNKDRYLMPLDCLGTSSFCLCLEALPLTA